MQFSALGLLLFLGRRWHCLQGLKYRFNRRDIGINQVIQFTLTVRRGCWYLPPLNLQDCDESTHGAAMDDAFCLRGAHSKGAVSNRFRLLANGELVVERQHVVEGAESGCIQREHLEGLAQERQAFLLNGRIFKGLCVGHPLHQIAQ